MDRISLLKSHLEESPNDPFLHFALAQEYIKLDDLGNAIRKYDLLLDQHPGYVGTYYHAGLAYEKLGILERAMEIYEKGIEVALNVGDKHSASELEGIKQLLQDRL